VPSQSTIQRACLDAHSVDHQRIAFVTTYGIAGPGRRNARWVLRVQPHVADVMIEHIKKYDLIVLLQKLNLLMP
jgi:hypothetical protein